MVLGMILYESIDLLYNVTKLGINAISQAYWWYYSIPQVNENTQLLLLEDRLEKQIEHLEQLEKKLEEKLNLKIETTFGKETNKNNMGIMV